MLTELQGDDTSVPRTLDALSTGSGSPRCAYMAGVAILAGGLESRIGMVGPDIRGLHTLLAVLAVGYCIPR